MNEVSNGTSGNQEYVEFVVVSNTVTYNCANTTPPCIDIRGWIFDDNSGLHGGTSGTGVAPGAIRFSQSSTWACVPLGTIILIYNDADKNPAIPADDISMADGNCRIIAPISSTALFESNPTTPGAVACSYPATGWVAGGDWTKTLLANPGDCARIVNLSGCEVFSVCYGAANTNNLIYYAGAGGQKVFYFNDTDPSNQVNWTSGSASPSPGAQTPGAPNNAANAAYIAQFNNGCMPITPIAIGTATTVNAGCTCSGTAKVNPTGSIGPYSYVWYDSNSVPIGQTSSTATGLCAGAYKVVTTSHIGCKDSVIVNITSTSTTPSVTVNNPTICSGGSATLTATPSTAGGTYLWTPGGQTTQTISVNPGSSTTYSVTYTLAGCSGSTTAVVSVSASATASLASSSPSLCASGQTATLSLSGSSGTYSWSNGATTSTTSVSSPGIYTATVTVPGCGNATTSISIGSSPLPTVSISAPSTSVCSGSSVTYTANSNSGNYVWTGGITTQTVSTNAPSITVTTTNTCGSAQATQTLTIVPIPTITVDNSSVTLCSGQSATVTATSSTSNYTWQPGGIQTNTISLTTGGVYTVNTSNACGNASTTVNVSTSSAPTLSIVSSAPFICASGQTITLSLAGSVGSYNWSTGATTSTTSISSPGVYSATVSTPGCGSAVANISLGAAPLPVVTISAPSSTSLCAGSSVVLVANSNENNYLWPGGITTQTFSANSSPVVVTSTNACGSSQATQTLNFVPAPTLTLSSNAVSLCSGQTATIQAITNTATTYSWSTGVTTSTVSLNTAGVYTVYASNACGTASSVVTVSVAISPSITTSATQTLLCSGQVATLTAVGNSGTYAWSNGATTPTTSVSNSGIYTVTLTNGCGQATSSVSITTLLTPTVTISPSSTILCPGTTVTLTATGNPGNYQWSTGDNTSVILVNTTGVKTVTVSNACGIATASVNVTNVSFPPLILTTSSNTICPNETATLTVTGGVPLTTGGPVLYSWSNSSSTGSIVTSSGGLVTVSNINACGTNTAAVMVSVVNLSASIIANPLSGTAPLVVSFGHNSVGAITYQWNFGNGQSSNSQYPGNQTYTNPGGYTAYLVVSDGFCTDIDSVIINVLEEEPTLYVPNAFTPNGDSINDRFYVSGTNIKDFHIIIFDRWGLKLYESSDILEGWDGKVNGKVISDGTYFHLINAVGTNEVEFKKQGTITLFK